MSNSFSSKMILVMHDVSPVFEAEIKVLLKALDFLPPSTIAAAVVPDWHGKAHPWTPAFTQQVQSSFGELVLHGYYHQTDENQRNGMDRWFNEWEFRGRSAEYLVTLLDRAQTFHANTFGTAAKGVVPPAWNRGALSPTLLDQLNLEYYLDYGYWHGVTGKQVPTATWSWDWGPLSGLHPLWNTVPGVRQGISGSLRQIVLHPMDVRRNQHRFAIRKIQSLLAEGYAPLLPQHITTEAQ